MKSQVIVTDFPWKDLSCEQNILLPQDIELVGFQCNTEEEVLAACKDADGVITNLSPISAQVIQGMKKCRVISRYGVGYNNVDIKAASNKGIIVCNVPDYCFDEVADHAFALMLALARKLNACIQGARDGSWNYSLYKPIFRLRGKVLGLVGFGSIARNLARKAQSFGLKIVAFDPYVSHEKMEQLAVSPVDLDHLCRVSDIVSIHVPLTDSTRGLIGQRQLEKMKPTAILINTARGPVVDEDALINALQAKMIAGAGLDVVKKEPIDVNNPLLIMPNVIVTPHMSWYSEEAEEELRMKAANNVLSVLKGGNPRYRVNS
ncbi:MAG: C-terminal binding protein [Bacillota bacterium]